MDQFCLKVELDPATKLRMLLLWNYHPTHKKSQVKRQTRKNVWDLLGDFQHTVYIT